jgi:YhcH/YjgK/YiaL family protein
MIFDTLDNLTHYQGLNSRLVRGLEYLRDTDFSQVEDGEYQLDGRNLFVRISHYETKPGNLTPEAHRDYADIQFLIDGAEKVGVAPLEDMMEEVKANPDGDIWLYHGPTEELTLAGSRFMVFFPQDAHAPCIAHNHPSTVRKCLVKVKL